MTVSSGYKHLHKPNIEKKILVTAALPYANGDIHLGHLVEYLQADFWVRFLKMQEDTDVIFLCADDTHGTPIMLRAQRDNISLEELIANVQERHIKDFSDFKIQFDHYSSTNSETNHELCNMVYKKMKDNQCLEKRKIRQAFSEKDQMFLPDRFIQGSCPRCSAKDQYGDSCSECGATYSPLDLKDARSTISGDKVVSKESEHIFFSLKPFQNFLSEWAKEHTSKEVFNKLKEWLEAGLKDWDISRDPPYFGFQIPETNDKYFYVWVDAPIGYIAATEEWCQKNKRKYQDYWVSENSEIYHFIGKDIIYFHTLFWPAMLKTAGFRVPDFIFVHGFLTVNGEKMSKSKGTFINAREYLNFLDPLYLRYYFASKLSPSIDDIDLNLEHFTGSVNSYLIGKITNLGSRSIQMLEKHFKSKIGKISGEGIAIIDKVISKGNEIAQYYYQREFAKAMQSIREIADNANQFFDEKAPWRTVKEDNQGTHAVLSIVVNIFRIIIIYLKPVLPDYASKVEKLFQEDPFYWSSAQETLEDHKLQPFQHLLQKIDPRSVQKLIEASKENI